MAIKKSSTPNVKPFTQPMTLAGAGILAEPTFQDVGATPFTTPMTISGITPTPTPTPTLTPTPTTSKDILALQNQIAQLQAALAGQDATAKLLAEQAAAATAAANQQARQSAYDLLYQQFNQYGLGSLVEGVKGLIQENVSPSEFAIRLQQTPAYQQRFSANKDRIAAGLRALSPAEYIGLEDQYQNIMRNYGLPASYYTKDATGKQPGFDKFLAGDVSAAELEDRIATAQQRVINANPEVFNALKQFYPDITNGDILAYTLDPKNALADIKRKVTAAEIGGAAMAQGFNRGTTPEEIAAYAARANELAGYGVTKAQAQQGFGTIAEFLPTAEKLGDIYAKQGLGGYTQTTAEQEVFGTAGAAQAAQKRRKLTELERASFAGSAGAAQSALARERAGQF